MHKLTWALMGDFDLGCPWSNWAPASRFSASPALLFTTLAIWLILHRASSIERERERERARYVFTYIYIYIYICPYTHGVSVCGSLGMTPLASSSDSASRSFQEQEACGYNPKNLYQDMYFHF